jgi:hypothetical protein
MEAVKPATFLRIVTSESAHPAVIGIWRTQHYHFACHISIGSHASLPRLGERQCMQSTHRLCPAQAVTPPFISWWGRGPRV